MTSGTGPEDPAGRLATAVRGVSSGLSLPDTLLQIVDAACTLVDAEYGALGVLGDDGQLAQFVTHGVSPETYAAIGHRPEGRGLLGLLIAEMKPLRLGELTTHPESVGFPPGHPPMRSFLGVPIEIHADVFANLYLCEKRGGDEFDADDQALVASLAAVAAVAIENARLHERLRDLAVLRERERIGRDLHDKVIQRLFAAGLSLQASARLADDSISARLDETIAELDETIAEIRATVSALEARPAHRPNLSAAVLGVVDEMARLGGIEPAVSIDGGLNVSVAPELGDELLAVLREALSNVVRHSGARNVEVVISADGDLSVEVTDDGRGLGASTTGRGRGLGNLTARARARGGSFSIESGDPHGARLEWRVPNKD